MRRGLFHSCVLVLGLAGMMPPVLRAEKEQKELTNHIGMKLVLIPAGSFRRGSPESDKDADSNEKPQHLVRISKSFYLGKFEVTQGEWRAVMATTPWKGKPHVQEGDDFPATVVSWDDAVDFCRRLTRKEGKTYRLPTEAEWEYACRGKTTTRFHFGDDERELGEYAWHDKNTLAAGESYTHRVGLKRANPFGLHDMHGNVWEWCSDRYNPKYDANSPTTDPLGPDGGRYRVDRGGSWADGPVRCRSAIRLWHTPSHRIYDLGFRVAQVRSGG